MSFSDLWEQTKNPCKQRAQWVNGKSFSFCNKTGINHSSVITILTADSSLVHLTVSSPFEQDRTETIHHKMYLSGFSLCLMSWASLSVPFTVFLKNTLFVLMKPFAFQTHLPELETAESIRTRAFISWLREQRPFFPILYIIK